MVVTNESHPEIKFDVFERLNTNTVPLNAQELRNCVSRGPLNDLLGELSFDESWLEIRGRKTPDRRLADEEIILRFFAFQTLKLATYKTPLKHWLNDAARAGRAFDAMQIGRLKRAWDKAISNSLILFEPKECFRRPGSKSINRALYDLTMDTTAKLIPQKATERREAFRKAFYELCADDDFVDLISRAVDHKSRTEKRFAIWNDRIAKVL